ncbi:glycosyltransferase [Pedobacter mucosus]|uniref:glycosyltransferase n=1 Tax=Pedobacter mucosus TaxID=2895286 RepID=UPI001EE3E911|nr:hypothetical protein [Pedobacter mucosus]UKT62239.1 hypothetical protein LOK61_10745 [Pedobacter mucosus]
MVTLITSQIPKSSPDISLLKNFEQFCAENSSWETKKGPVLFNPRRLSLRFYSAFHLLLKPFLRKVKVKGAVLSLGLPYYYYLLSKTFPYYTKGCDLRVLWTYDVWEPDYKRVEDMVNKSDINLLLLSSHQAASHFKNLKLRNCKVHWVPETVNVNEYKQKPWTERKINILSFGRSWHTYHDLIVSGCEKNKINYQYQERNENKDTAVHGLKKGLQFPTWSDFVNGLSDAQICICFPRSVTHPLLAGNVSTLTIRYLQAMASKCLIIGSAPKEIEHLLNYNPVIEVNWDNPVEQILEILENPEPYQNLIEKNYRIVKEHFHHINSIERIEKLINTYLPLQN